MLPLLRALAGFTFFVALRGELRFALRRLLEALMVEKTPFGELEVPEWLRKAESAARNEGKVEGRAEALLTVLAARGITVSRERAAEVMACTSAATLTRWLRAAVTAKTEAEVFGAPKRRSKTR